jgi:hypothetical protein
MISGGEGLDMILNSDNFLNKKLSTYGYSLTVVYIVWALVVLLLYPICKKYMIYKATNKQKWWLSYL